MNIELLIQTVILGLVEGLTEFLPVSSTGHLILMERLIGFEGPPGKVFEIVIQLGAILAICVLYWRKLLGVVLGLTSQPSARWFVTAIILAFLPAAVIGALAHGIIKTMLFSPWVVSVSLIVGGIAILVIERIVKQPWITDITQFTPATALSIGCCQVLAMVPGVSRSGATIMGALMLGVERRTAAEFSFFLAIPTMLGATVYDLYKNRGTLDLQGGGIIAIGFLVAFVTALIVVRALVAYLGRHGFTPFAWYRIGLGTLMLIVLSLGF